VIAQWNFPIAGSTVRCSGAASGQRSRDKASEYAPLTTQWYADALAPSHCELPGASSRPARRRREGRRWRAGNSACALTGSPRTGLPGGASDDASSGIPVEPSRGVASGRAIVLEDCDRERTVARDPGTGARERGRCGRRRRSRSSRSISPPTVAGLATRARLRWPAPSPTSRVGNRRQLEIVEDHVADAVARGATLVCGGQAHRGRVFYPRRSRHCTEERGRARQRHSDVTSGRAGRRRGRRRSAGQTSATRPGASIWTRDLCARRTARGGGSTSAIASVITAFTGAVAA